MYKTVPSDKILQFEILPSEVGGFCAKHHDCILIDVREPYENEDFPGIEGAVNLPLSLIDQWDLSSIGCEKDSFVLLYCLSGARSLVALEYLHACGYKNVFHLKGGLSAM